MTVDCLVICDDAGRDGNGKSFARGIFDRILSERFPRHISTVTFLVHCVGDPGEEHEVLFEIVDDRGVSLEGVTTTLEVGPYGGSHIPVEARDLELPRAGRYEIRLSAQGLELCATPLWAFQLPPSPARAQ